MWSFIYIYIYIEREREIIKNIYIYIYIYIYNINDIHHVNYLLLLLSSISIDFRIHNKCFSTRKKKGNFTKESIICNFAIIRRCN